MGSYENCDGASRVLFIHANFLYNFADPYRSSLFMPVNPQSLCVFVFRSKISFCPPVVVPIIRDYFDEVGIRGSPRRSTPEKFHVCILLMSSRSQVQYWSCQFQRVGSIGTARIPNRCYNAFFLYIKTFKLIVSECMCYEVSGMSTCGLATRFICRPTNCLFSCRIISA